MCSLCGRQEGNKKKEAHLRKHFPRIQVSQEYLLGVNQLLSIEGAADISKSLLFSLAAKLDILIQICPLTQDAPQVAWPRDARHLKKKKKKKNFGRRQRLRRGRASPTARPLISS